MSPSASSVASLPRYYRTTVIGALGLCGLFYALSIWYARHIDWNAIRLAPGAALLFGETIYPAATSGILTGHIYSPLGALAFAPVAWWSDISAMMSAGSALALGYFALPFIMLARGAVRRGEATQLDALAITTAVLLLAAFDVRLRCAATMVHAESPAVGLGALAIVLAAAADGLRPRGWWWAGALAVAATLSKQTLLPTWLGLAALACLDGRRAAWSYAKGTLAITIALAACLTLAGHWQNFIFNCLWVPAHHPWLTSGYAFVFGSPPSGQGFAERGRALADAVLQLAAAWWPALVIAAWSLRGDALRQARSAPPLLRTAIFGSLCAVLQFPLALASFVKVGGDVNVLDPLLTPLTLVLAALAFRAVFSATPAITVPIRPFLTAVLLILAACNLPRLGFLAQAAATRTEPNRAMLAHLRANPGEVYLPWNPLHTWVAERRRDHFEYGVFDRALAGSPITPQHYRAHLPPRLRWVAVRKSQPALRLDMYRHYLPGLRPIAAPAGLEGWNFYATDQGAGIASPANRP